MARFGKVIGARFAAALRAELLRDPEEYSRIERVAVPRIARLAVSSSRTVKRAKLRREQRHPFTERLAEDRFPRPHYAYGVYYAASQARALGISAISVYEFGVGWGAGLLDLEQVAELVERETSVSIHVYGFDTGTGMPEPIDYRDLPNVWQPTFFQMDVDKLKASLRRAKLVLGDVRETVPDFIEAERPAPVGFVAIDVDYYSSAAAVLRLFESHEEFLLPRVYCYLDDIVGDDWETMSEYVGELLAVKEFNARHDQRKISQIHGLRFKRPIPAAWNDQMYVLHVFDHSAYCTYVRSKPEWEVFKRPPAWYQIQ